MCATGPPNEESPSSRAAPKTSATWPCGDPDAVGRFGVRTAQDYVPSCGIEVASAVGMSTVGDPDALHPRPPAFEPADALVTPGAGSAPAAGRPCIVVVDDSEEMRLLLRDVLVARGYEVLTASSSGRALALMRQRTPDLVITDLMMPGMSGFSLRSLMLRHSDLSSVPVIVLSGYWARPSETLDAVAVLTKPVNLDRLLEHVELALARRTS